MRESRIPFSLIGVLGVLVLVKTLMLYALSWMITEDVIPGAWLRSDPYSAGDITGVQEILLALANRWDSQHFIEIARNGYPLGVSNDLLFAFAPLYPWMIAVLNSLLGNLYLSATIVSNIFYFVAVVSFYKVARLYMPHDYACLSTLAFGLFPTFITYGTLAYSEAPYLAFAISAWYFFKKEQYAPSAVLTTLAILTRYVSALLLAVYAIAFLMRLAKAHGYPGFNGSSFSSFLRWIGRSIHSFFSLLWKSYRGVLWFALPVVAVLVFFSYLGMLTGSFFVAFDAHVFFRDRLMTPIHQFVWFFEGFFTEINPGVEPMLLVLLRYMFTLPFLGLAIALFRDDTELGVYGLVFMWFTLSMEGISGIASPRIMLCAWVALLAFRDRTDKSLYLAIYLLFLVVGVWVLYQFEMTFFA